MDATYFVGYLADKIQDNDIIIETTKDEGIIYSKKENCVFSTLGDAFIVTYNGYDGKRYKRIINPYHIVEIVLRPI